MKAGIATIRKELNGIYSKQEIESLIVLIFDKLKGYSRTRLLLANDELLTDNEIYNVNHIVARLKNHEPIQYILGTTEFYGLNFSCVPGVLIPRPETEELVDWIIKENTVTNPVIIDLGTGTGCIAVSLQKNIPHAKVFACDISPVCIQTAIGNAIQNNVEIIVVEYDILNIQPQLNFPGFDIIVSNPPYICESEKVSMEKNVIGFEPELALFVSNENPLIFYEHIANFALTHLKNRGKLYFEINELHGSECCKMLDKKGFTHIELKKDINGKDRMIACTFSKD